VFQCHSPPGDPSIPDIAMLFSPVKSPDTDTASKLDSGSLKEEDYDSVHAEIFSWDSRSTLVFFYFHISHNSMDTHVTFFK
jgi:hypothetical protein